MMSKRPKAYNFLSKASRLLPEEALFDKLSQGVCRIKFGADPSAPDLHLGHVVVLLKLKRLQALGHRIVFVIGSFTAQIGDPTGSSKTRPVLSKEQVLAHAKSYQEQVFKLLDQDKTDVLYNHEWLDRLSPQEIVHLASQMTVARMMERDDFSKRFSSQVPIGIHEFLYPLLQIVNQLKCHRARETVGIVRAGFVRLLLAILLSVNKSNTFQFFSAITTISIYQGTLGFSQLNNNINPTTTIRGTTPSACPAMTVTAPPVAPRVVTISMSA